MNQVVISTKGKKMLKNRELCTAVVIAVSSSKNQKALNTTGLKVCAGGECIIIKNSKP